MNTDNFRYLVASDQQVYKREVDIAMELGKIADLADDLERYRQKLVLLALSKERFDFDIWNIASDLRLRAKAMKEQILVVDAIRSRPFCNEITH